MENYLKKLLSARKAKLAKLQERNEKSESLEEVRSLSAEITEVTEEIRGIEMQLAQLETQNNNDGDATGTRSVFEPNKALNVVTVASMNNGQARQESDDILSSMEYRKAFMSYAQTGVRSEELNRILNEYRTSPEYRAASENVSTDLGVLIPHTVIQEFIKKIGKVRGNIYSRVRKLNVPGGIEIPIADFEATFTWSGANGNDAEHGVSEEQKGGAVEGSVTFAYHIGEVRLAESLLASILAVDIFEQELVEALVKAYLTAMDIGIVKGTGSGQLTGITTNVDGGLKRIPANNIIEFTEDEIADWKQWEKKLFGIIPLGMEGENPEFVMAKQTYVSNICTLVDDNNQPIGKAGFDSDDKKHKFNEYEVNRVEQDIFKAFDLCSDGEYFGMFWAPEKAYGVNTNLQFGYKRYFDEDKNKYINKGLVIVDGKILNPNYIFLLKKKVKG